MMLFWWSVAAVFSELALVRMITTIVGAMSYYGSSFYVAALFFIGCGFMVRPLERRRNLIAMLLAVTALTAWWLSHYNMLETLTGEFQWYAFANTAPKPVDFSLQWAVLILVLSMAPPLILIGAAQAEAFEAVSGVASYLTAAAGGITGAGLFMLQNQYASNLGWLLIVWCFTLLLASPAGMRQKLLYVVAPFAVILLMMHSFIQDHYWSPYQRLTIKKTSPTHYSIYTNDIFIMYLETAPVENRPPTETIMHGSAFNGLKPDDRVLVLGSGAGTNDVALALNKGVKRVVAVEIDPEIISLANRFDPQHTYQDPRVELVNTDARRFVNSDRRTYNMVFLPTLDSQTNASNFARFRLDSFLYTLDGLRAIWNRVDRDGYLVLSFATGTDWLPMRLWAMLQKVTGNRTRAYWFNDGGNLTLFVACKDRQSPLIPAPSFSDISPALESMPKASYLPTDDSPFLYNRYRAVPPEHLRLTAYLLVLLLSIPLAAKSVAKLRPWDEMKGVRGTLSATAVLFGGAFFFMQLRAVSLLTPVVGSTYLGLSLVVIGTIVGSLAGSLLAVKVPWLRIIAWIALFVSLAGSIPLTALFLGSSTPGTIVASIQIFLPFACAGYIYTTLIRELDSRQIMIMQMWNMIGGCIGGLFEWSVIYTGFRYGVLIPIALYFVAMLLACKRPAGVAAGDING
ncbi:MAG: hypothetical protein M0023_13050 [Desulfobacteraceae bacterium]|nr:hypothetical protein [Desulfobacteraceae bacterium]